MPDLKIHREHRLGLAHARKVAWAWAEQAEKKFGMECTVLEGELSDTVDFVRSGVKGRLIVAADHFDLEATLGFLLGAFSKTIEHEIEKELDQLLAGSAARAKPAGAAGKAGRTSKRKT
jgi:putative polyhydroxyalkanoate system protein